MVCFAAAILRFGEDKARIALSKQSGPLTSLAPAGLVTGGVV